MTGWIVAALLAGFVVGVVATASLYNADARRERR